MTQFQRDQNIFTFSNVQEKSLVLEFSRKCCTWQTSLVLHIRHAGRVFSQNEFFWWFATGNKNRNHENSAGRAKMGCKYPYTALVYRWQQRLVRFQKKGCKNTDSTYKNAVFIHDVASRSKWCISCRGRRGREWRNWRWMFERAETFWP